MVDQIAAIISITALVMVSPGPDMLLVLRNTLVDGRRAGLQTSAGILTGNMVHITYCVTGIGWLISRSIVAFATLKYAGAAYLVYLGVMSFRSGTNPLTVTGGKPEQARPGWFAQGLVNNVLNPKGALFYLGVFTVLITPDTSIEAMLLLVCVMMIVSASFWLLFVYTLDRSLIRELIQRSQRTVNRIFGVLLVLLGIRVAAMER